MSGLDRESTRRSAKAGDLTLNYYEAGEPTSVGGGLPLVMLHGGGPGASAWSNFGSALPGFAEDFRTLLIDQPGFGQSDKPPVDGNYFRFAAEAVKDLLDELGIDRLHLLGNSLGGGTAARFALLYPERIGRLVLMGPGGLNLSLFHADPTEGVKGSWSSAPRRLRSRCGRSSPPWWSTRTSSPTSWSPSGSPTRRLRARKRRCSRWACRSGTRTAIEDGLVWRDAHKITRPTLLTWGREDRVNPLDGAFVALKMIPKASLHVFPNCGHWAQIEAAEEFREICTAYLARHVERKDKK